MFEEMLLTRERITKAPSVLENPLNNCFDWKEKWQEFLFFLFDVYTLIKVFALMQRTGTTAL